MKKSLSKENFILLYLALITGIYPVLLTPDKIQHLLGWARYPSVLSHYFLVFFLFFVVPAGILSFVYKLDLKEVGFNLSHAKPGLQIILVLVPLLLLLIFFSSRTTDFIHEYPLAKIGRSQVGLLLVMEFFYLLYYVGWEFLFRGLVMVGLRKYPLVLLLVLQTVPSTLLHYSKPGGEIVLALVAGFVLGFCVFKYRTIWFAVAIHFIAGCCTDLFTLYRN